MLVYDLEIVNAIPTNKGPQDAVTYCKGWTDYAGMDISVFGCYDTLLKRYRVFCFDNKDEAKVLFAEHKGAFISFNGIAFDNRVLSACWGIDIPESLCYDLLIEIWAAHGLGPVFNYRTHAGFSLGQMLLANGLGEKSGKGSNAPMDWQHGKIGTVIDYCLEDVRQTTRLYQLAQTEELVSPRDGKKFRLRECQ
jgi:hypothetical protein